MVTFFDSTKKALTKRPSSSKPISNYPPLTNGKPRGDPDSRRHHESPKKEPTTVCNTHAPVDLREKKDDVHTQKLPTNPQTHVDVSSEGDSDHASGKQAIAFDRLRCTSLEF
jgi:hypothetical protein